MRSSGVPVLELEDYVDGSTGEIIAAERDDDVQSVALGCGGMVKIERFAAPNMKVRLIDGVRSAALIASAW